MEGTRDSAVTGASSWSLSLLSLSLRSLLLLWAAEGEAVEVVRVSKPPQGFSPKDNVGGFLSLGTLPILTVCPPHPQSVFSSSFAEAEEEAWGFCMGAGQCLFLDQN